MFTPAESLESKRKYSDGMQEYFKCEDETWLYEKWRIRTNKQIPELARRVFELRHKHYIGCGCHYSIERTLGSIIAQLNNYDDYPIESQKMKMYHIALKVKTRMLFESVARAEESIKEREHI